MTEVQGARPPRLAGGDPRLRLLDLPLAGQQEALMALMSELGQPAYRAAQVMRAIWGESRRSFADLTTLPRTLRDQLEAKVRIGLMELSRRQASADGTVKYLWRLADGAEIESVAIPSPRRVTFCISSQAGCSLHCRFCATAYLGLARNLTHGEIVDQVLAMLADMPARPTSLNVVFMGMGEPGHNVPAVLEATRTLNEPQGGGVGARHITLSTSGVIPFIDALRTGPLQVRLAVSLHAGTQDKRIEIMDIAGKHELDDLLDACSAYARETGRHVTFEYAVIPGFNDSAQDAEDLARAIRAIPSKVNLIPYNAVPEFQAASATHAEAESFSLALVAAGYPGEVVTRTPRGRDIEAACGMLRRVAADAR